jgi:hydrogenase-4 component E
MRSSIEPLLLGVLLTNFAVLGMSRVTACVRMLAVQGALLGVLSVAIEGTVSLHSITLGAGTIVVKALVLPWFLRWAMREAAVRREVEPVIGYMASLLVGAVVVGVSFAVAGRLPSTPATEGTATQLLVPTALSTLLSGLLVLITRSKAITQVVGYLMLENGVYLFGLTLVGRISFLVEVGVLLDVFVAVFIMGIVVFHINREFDSISAENLVELRES